MKLVCYTCLAFTLFCIVTAQAQQNIPPKIYSNTLRMKFARISTGSFLMGSPKTEIRLEEEPQHKVTLTHEFYMGVYAVTQQQWKEVMGNNPSGFEGEASLPVENVSWNDCQDFIKKLQSIDKKRYRLPTEAEWEYACRAGTITPFHFGKTISSDQANYNGEITYADGKRGKRVGKTIPVGSFPPNAWGLYDMHGNVWQWCQDWYGDYPAHDVIDPQGPEAGRLRVQRGGAWDNIPEACRSACRAGSTPGRRDRMSGFRLCFTAD